MSTVGISWFSKQRNRNRNNSSFARLPYTHRYAKEHGKGWSSGGTTFPVPRRHGVPLSVLHHTRGGKNKFFPLPPGLQSASIPSEKVPMRLLKEAAKHKLSGVTNGGASCLEGEEESSVLTTQEGWRISRKGIKYAVGSHDPDLRPRMSPSQSLWFPWIAPLLLGKGGGDFNWNVKRERKQNSLQKFCACL